jgi:hypothetical protein
MSPVLGQSCAPFFHPGLTTHRRENRKTRHKNEILRANEGSLCVETSDLSNDTKKHTTKSRETIPLSFKLLLTLGAVGEGAASRNDSCSSKI